MATKKAERSQRDYPYLSSLTVLAKVTYMLSRLVYHKKVRYGLFLFFFKTVFAEFSVNLTA